MIYSAVEDRVAVEVQKLGNLLALDMNAMLRNANEEIERLGYRLKNLEETLKDHKPTQTENQNPAITHQEQVGGESKMEVLEDIKETDQNYNTKEKSGTCVGQNHTSDNARIGSGWTMVKSKRARKRKAYAVGAVLIGGENVRRISTAAKEEFVFEDNVAFVPAQEAGRADIQHRLPAAIQKTNADAVDVVIHLEGDDITDSDTDNVLEKFSHIINAAKERHNTRDVVVCSVMERRDVGRSAAEKARLVNDQLGALCATYGARYLDLRSRLRECMHQGINRTGRLYTWEGARNMSQMIISEVNGFLD